jgi:hypothetical protein
MGDTTMTMIALPRPPERLFGALTRFTSLVPAWLTPAAKPRPSAQRGYNDLMLAVDALATRIDAEASDAAQLGLGLAAAPKLKPPLLRHAAMAVAALLPPAVAAVAGASPDHLAMALALGTEAALIGDLMGPPLRRAAADPLKHWRATFAFTGSGVLAVIAAAAGGALAGPALALALLVAATAGAGASYLTRSGDPAEDARRARFAAATARLAASRAELGHLIDALETAHGTAMAKLLQRLPPGARA